MDLFLAICQALGVGLALGILAGAPGLAGSAASRMALATALVGAVLAAISISSDDEPVVLGIVLGAVAAPAAFLVSSGVVAGAARRAEGGEGGIQLFVVVGALVLAGLSILLPPISLLAVAGLVWLGL